MDSSCYFFHEEVSVLFLQYTFCYISWYQSKLNPGQMANTQIGGKLLDNDDHEEEFTTRTEFRTFQHETQQALQEIQATLLG